MRSNEVGRGQTGLLGDIRGIQILLSINTLQIQSRGQSENQWSALPTDPPNPVASSLCILLVCSESRWPVSTQIKASKSSDQREITHLSFSTLSEKQIEALRTQAGVFQDPKKANKLNNSDTNGSKKMEQVCPKKVRDSHRLSSKINRRYLSPKGS